MAKTRNGGQEQGESSSEFDDDVVAVNRTSAVVKGGRRFSFNAVVVVGNRRGLVGVGFGKAKEYADAVKKAIKDAHKNLISVNLKGTTIPHYVKQKYSASLVVLKPACNGTGMIASKPVRIVCELAGISNILTKSYGSNNAMNLAKATLAGLESLKNKKQVEMLRGVKL